jgi:hypothetical protein
MLHARVAVIFSIFFSGQAVHHNMKAELEAFHKHSALASQMGMNMRESRDLLSKSTESNLGKLRASEEENMKGVNFAIKQNDERFDAVMKSLGRIVHHDE